MYIALRTPTQSVQSVTIVASHVGSNKDFGQGSRMGRSGASGHHTPLHEADYFVHCHQRVTIGTA